MPSPTERISAAPKLSATVLEVSIMETVDKLNIADEMLDAAIDEFLDRKRYFSAVNLACVAEEIYGKFVRTEGGRDAQHDLINDAIQYSVDGGGPDYTTKEMKAVANHNKNSIKHFDSGADRFIEIDSFDEARLSIATAMENHARAGRTETEAHRRFKEFATEYVHHHLLNSD